jgi:5-dehydro-2-deoxygluconokinase
MNNQQLFILPFDHRASFAEKMFGIEDREPTVEEAQMIYEYKNIIYHGFRKAVENEMVPSANSAILVDEHFGDQIIQDARTLGYGVCIPTEKSGQDEFDFEYGENFSDHIEKYMPQMVKALIRYNPEGDNALNARQRQRLKKLSDYCHENSYQFLIEPLVPATTEQLKRVNGNQDRYDDELRADLMVKMVEEMHQDGVTPDIWKIEGFNKKADYEKVVSTFRQKTPKAFAIVLGRAASDEQVERWLKAGAEVEGVYGFAVGRTIFWQSLIDYKEGKITDEQAAIEIADRFAKFYRIFVGE